MERNDVGFMWSWHPFHFSSSSLHLHLLNITDGSITTIIANPLCYALLISTIHETLLNLLQLRLKRQLARRATNMHRLGIIADNPVLRLAVPVRHVASRQCGLPHLLLAASKRNPVELAERSHRVIRSTKGNILRELAYVDLKRHIKLTSCGTSSPGTLPVFLTFTVTSNTSSYRPLLPPGAPLAGSRCCGLPSVAPSGRYSEFSMP